MTPTEATVDVAVRLIGNDDGDVQCSVCNRRDWYQALQFTRDDAGQERRTTLCLRRFAGQSCGELAKRALFQTTIPAGTFDPVSVP